MLIGLTSDASRVGKDETAGYLVKNHGFTKISLADPIREALLLVYDDMPGRKMIRRQAETFGWDFVKDAHSWTVDNMIALGQFMRTLYADIWAQAIRAYDPETSRICVADVRQPNEVALIRELGGEIWKIERDGGVKRDMDGLLLDNDIDYIIDNNGTLELLETSVNFLMEGWNDRH